jgi:hypothetical protein
LADVCKAPDARNRRRLASGPNIASEIDPVLARVLTRTRQ